MESSLFCFTRNYNYQSNSKEYFYYDVVNLDNLKTAFYAEKILNQLLISSNLETGTPNLSANLNTNEREQLTEAVSILLI